MNYEKGIYGFFDNYRFLSNYHILEEPVHLFGFDYLTTETAYQAAKSLDREVHQQFSFIVDPKESKRRGQEIEMRPDWEHVKDFYMFEVNRQKYLDPKLEEKLLATEDWYLEETNWWGDNYWGYCTSASRVEVLQRKYHEPGTVGLNKLGFTLMTIREVIAGRYARFNVHK